MSSRTKYRNFKLTGPVNVVRTSPRELKGHHSTVYLLMGPTGSGKSAFIESLSDGTLSISKNTLESVTQEVICYRVVNMIGVLGTQVILMDTPGFLDTKLSESRIASMIMRTLDELWWVVVVDHDKPLTRKNLQSLYIRVGASKRDIAKLSMEFAKMFEARGIQVATTMWNTIHTPEKMAAAEVRRVALRTDVFKSGDFRISVCKFEFSRESALLVLNGMPDLFLFINNKQRDSSFRSMAQENLLHRIRQAQQQLQILAEDSIHARTPGSEDHQLLEIIEARQKMVAGAHDSFLQDLYDLDPTSYQSNFPHLPCPPPPQESSWDWKYFFEASFHITQFSLAILALVLSISEARAARHSSS